MTTQSSLWQAEQVSTSYAELCNALFERELHMLTTQQFSQASAVQSRLKSLPYYIRRTAHSMSQIAVQGDTPLSLDVQNAAWSSKQASKNPALNVEHQLAVDWFVKNPPVVGLVVAVGFADKVMLDCVDRIDSQGCRFRTNANGWFSYSQQHSEDKPAKQGELLKPSKKVMTAACAGHRWRDTIKTTPQMLTLRELLLSCQINWRNFKKPLLLPQS